MYPRREFLEPLGQTARRLRAIVAEVKAQDALAPGDRKIKRPFPPTASAHLMPPCCHPARCCPRLGSARTPWHTPGQGVARSAPRPRLARAGGRWQAARRRGCCKRD